ncbi:hypothetical protein [Streptomyces rubiginosohelvolus]|uniref:hypothetical protein n=1 Tax=Streptomyces rubiginosohelvolus TaxID=67362 RepID=UPI0035E260A0
MSPIDSIATGAQVGVILPLLTAVVQRPAWSAKAKQIVAAAAALVAGVLTVAVDGGWAQFQHGTHTTLTVLGVLAAAQTSYDLLWKPTKLAPLIEAATSRKGSQQAE